MERRDIVYSIGFGEEVMRVEGDVIVYEIKCENGNRIVLKCNLAEKEMKIMEGLAELTNAHEIMIDNNTVIDLNDNGERWEGGSLFGKPFGFGMCYDNNNKLQYCGYMFEGKRVCFGETYFSDGNVEYSGYFMNDKRHGKGSHYDRYGYFISENNWHLGECSPKLIIPSNCNDNRQFTDNVENLIIEDSCYKDLRRLHFSNNCVLKRLVIGDNCFSKVNELTITNGSKLQSVVIGKKSFMNAEDKQGKSGRLLINNCKELEKIEIGDQSFKNYREKFEMLSIIMK